MKTIEEAARAYIQALTEARAADRRWRQVIQTCDGDPKCLFAPDTTAEDMCDTCRDASILRAAAWRARHRKDARLRTLVAACARGTT